MGWKATHRETGNVIEGQNDQDVRREVEQLGHQVADYEWQMTRIPPAVGGFVDGRPGYVGGELIRQHWQRQRDEKRPPSGA